MNNHKLDFHNNNNDFKYIELIVFGGWWVGWVQVEKATSRTGEKEIAEERRKAKEEEAKMELHESKAHHKAQREHAKHEREYPLDGHERLSAMHGHHYSAATNPAPDKYL